MDNGQTILCCKRCGCFLVQQPDCYICQNCFQSYPVREGILFMEEGNGGRDLRIRDSLLDLYELRKKRRYHGSYIKSDVEYAARLHSVNFSDLHPELLSPYLSNSTVLDLGCGQIPYMDSFPDGSIKSFYGIDLNQESLMIAKRNFIGKFPMILIKHGVDHLPFREGSFDVVISSEVLEHLDNPKDYLSEIHRLIKNGGYLSLSTPCVSIHFYPHNLPMIVTGSVKWYKLVNCHHHWKEALNWHPSLRPDVLRDWVKEAGFSIKGHETRLWYYHTPLRLMWRLFLLVERGGILSAGEIFLKYLKWTDTLLASHIPIVRWFGTRQFILCQKH